MRWKLFKAAALGAVLACAPVGWGSAVNVSAAQEEYEKAIGLIEKCTLTCNVTGDGFINISAKTQVSSVMEEVGYKNVVIQRTDDGENWVDEVYLGDLIGYNTRYYSIDNMRVKVQGGGEYRVVCDHYAKGIPYGDTQVLTQTATNSSSWSEQPIVTSADPSAERRTTTTTTTVTVPPTSSAPRTTSASTAKTSSSTTATSSKQTTTSGGSSSATTAAVTTTKPESKSSPKAADAPTTGVEFPVAALAVLAGATAVGFKFRKTEKK